MDSNSTTTLNSYSGLSGSTSQKNINSSVKVREMKVISYFKKDKLLADTSIGPISFDHRKTCQNQKQSPRKNMNQ